MPNAVTSAKVRDGSLLAADFRTGQLPTGPAGGQGPAGAPGSAVAYARVDPFPGSLAGSGTVDAANSKNVTQANVSHAGVASYCFSGLSFTPHNAVVSI